MPDIKASEIVSKIESLYHELMSLAHDCYKASGEIRSTFDPPDPGEPGWQAMVKLSDEIELLADKLTDLVPDEVREVANAECSEDQS